MIGIYKYRSSNYFSLASALKKAKIKFKLSENFESLMKLNKIIIPGVGHAGSFFEKQDAKILKNLINSFTKKGGLIYGICLGAQVFLEMSEESAVKTCAIFDGKTVQLKRKFKKLMNVGFKELNHNKKNTFFKKLFKGIENEKFYFLHKYYCDLEQKNLEKVFFNYENKKLIAAFFKDGIVGTQFHPELSKTAGLKLLKNFSNL